MPTQPPQPDAPRDGAQADERLRALLDEQAAQVAGQTYTGWHLLCLGAQDGSWQAAELATATGLGGDPPHGAVLRDAATAWRRDRRLLAGSDLKQWLTDHSQTMESWRAYLERSLRARGEPDEVGADGQSATGAATATAVTPELAAALAIDLVCSGQLGRLAGRLVRCAAAGLDGAGEAQSSPAAPPPPSEVDSLAATAAQTLAARSAGRSAADLHEQATAIVALQREMDDFARQHLTERAVARHVHDQRLDWTRLIWEEARFGSESAAREAALMVDLDRMPLQVPVQRAHAQLIARTEELGQLQGTVASLLAATVPDQIVGPWCEEDEWCVAHLLAREDPDPADATTRRRAEDHLLDTLLAARSAGRASIRWP